MLDHEPGENDPKSPFDGVVMSEAATPLRKALVAQEKGAIGILFVADVNNHPGPQNFEALARSAWPQKPPRIDRYTLQDWVERVRIPAAQVSVATARILLGDGKGSLEEVAQHFGEARSLFGFSHQWDRRHLVDGCQPPRGAGP